MREQTILEAAKRLFYTRGFDAVGVAELGSAAGMSGPALYRHFKSKDEILATLFDEAIDRLLLLSLPERQDPLDDLRSLADAHVRFALDEPELLSIYAREDRSLHDTYRRQLRRRQRQFLERWKSPLARILPEATSDEDLTGVAHALIGMILSTANWPADVRLAPGAHKRLVALVVAAATGVDAAFAPVAETPTRDSDH